MKGDSRPERLITQTLVAAARTYEQNDEMTWTAVRQLAILIDLFCLHDRLTVLGRQAYWMLTKGSELSALGLDIINLEEFNSHSDVVKNASRRIASYLNQAPKGEEALTREEDYRKLIEATFEPQHVERAFSPSPDYFEDFNVGAEWLRTFPHQNQDIRVKT